MDGKSLGVGENRDGEQRFIVCREGNWWDGSVVSRCLYYSLGKVSKTSYQYILCQSS